MSKVMLVGSNAAMLAQITAAMEIAQAAEPAREQEDWGLKIKSPYAYFPKPKQEWQGNGKRKKPRIR